jgi:hypothetical protein
MRLKFQHTLADIMETNCSAFEQRIKGWLVLAMAFSLIIIGFVVSLYDGDQTMLFVGLPFLALGLLGTRIAGIGAWFLKARRSSSYDIEVSETGITFFEVSPPTNAAWEIFLRWVETKNLILSSHRSTP